MKNTQYTPVTFIKIYISTRQRVAKRDHAIISPIQQLA